MPRIVSVGHAVPERRVTSAELERRLGLETGWIERRTGIRERRYAGPDEATSDLAVRAGLVALKNAGTLAKPIGLLLLATSTPDHLLPPTAPLVAHRLGLTGCGAIDLANACGGFLAALALGHSYCKVQQCSVLIIAANVLSKRLNPADPMTAGLFADAAGALLLTPCNGIDDGVLSLHLDTQGEHYDHIRIPAGGSREPISRHGLESGRHWIRMERGQELFRLAVRGMARAGEIAMEKAGLAIRDIAWWVPHQANARLIREAGARLGIESSRILSIIEEFGNSSSATIPLALSLAWEQGRIRTGQRLLLTAAGAGLVEAGAVIHWQAAVNTSSSQ